MNDGFSEGRPSPEVRPEMGEYNAGADAKPAQGSPFIAPEEFKDVTAPDELITKMLEKLPEDQRDILGYALRYLPHHMRASGMTEDEVQEELDEIKFPQILR